MSKTSKKPGQPWVPTEADDLADPPGWAMELPSNAFRLHHTFPDGEKVHAAPLCRRVSEGQYPPILVNRHRLIPRHPLYVISYSLWERICELDEDMIPPEEQMGYAYPAGKFREMLSEHVYLAAYWHGIHSFAKSLSGNRWHVAFAPRLWMEEGWRVLAQHKVPQAKRR